MYLKHKRKWLFALKLLISILIILWIFKPEVRHLQPISPHLEQPIPFDPVPSADSVTKTSIAELKPHSVNPYTLSYSGSTVTALSSANRNLYVALNNGLEAWTDSLEAEKAYYKSLDSLRRNNIPVSSMRIPREFLSKIHSYSLKNIQNVVLGSGSGVVAVSPTSFYVTHSRPSRIDGKTISLSGANTNVSNSVLVNGTLNLNGWNSSISDSRLSEMSINSHTEVQIAGCIIQNCRLDFSGSTALLYGDTIVSDNTLVIGDSASIRDLHGDGTLAITTSAGLAPEMQDAIQRYRRRYGDIRGFETYAKAARLFVSNLDLRKIKFDDTNIFLVIDTSENNKLVTTMFEQAIDLFKDNPEQRIIYDVAFRKYILAKQNSAWASLKDFFREYWDYYGYEPDQIFGIILRTFLFFFAINLLFFRSLLHDGYDVSNFKETYDRKDFAPLFSRLVVEVFYSFLYTLVIFWVFRIDLSRLKVDRPLLVSWVVLQHLLSLILLTFAIRAILI